MDKAKFITDQLKPYLLDPNLCGYEDGGCCYYTSEGKMCVVESKIR